MDVQPPIQSRHMDEIDAGRVANDFIQAVIDRRKLTCPSSRLEYKNQSGSTKTVVLWVGDDPVAFAVLVRTLFNYTVVTCFEIPERPEPEPSEIARLSADLLGE